MLKVVEPGILTTIQDAGRWGHQSAGVPVSGAMDWFAFTIANQLVGNTTDAATLEIRSLVVLETGDRHLVALTGADAIVHIDGRVVPTWSSVFVRAGSVIQVMPQRAGGWIYLAVRGGIAVPRVLDSRSTFLRGGFGGLEGRALQVGDVLPVGAADADLVALAGRFAPERVRAFANRQSPIRVVLGPHADWFASGAIAALTASEYVLTESADRMGYRFAGAALSRRREGELLSCGVPLGAIQIPPDGQLIVLMADHQTTGGYPIIATVIRADLPIVAQCVAGERVTFEVVEIAEAQQALRTLRDSL